MSEMFSPPPPPCGHSLWLSLFLSWMLMLQYLHAFRFLRPLPSTPWQPPHTPSPPC